MIEYNLTSFVEQYSRSLASKVLAVTVVAVGYALKAKRDIRFVDYGDGSFSAYEVKKLSPRVTIDNE
jgi:hypothetical protein